MKLTNKILSMLTIAGFLLSTGCSEEPKDDPDPIKIETEPRCYLKSETRITQSNESLTRYGYSANNNLNSTNEDGVFIALEYSNDKVSKVNYDNNNYIDIHYSGESKIPNRIDYNFDYYKSYTIIEATQGLVTKSEHYNLESGESELQEVVDIEYNQDNTLRNITIQEYDAAEDRFTVTFTWENIVSDDKINPYTSSQALIVLSLIEGDYNFLGNGNMLKADRIFFTDNNLKMSYSYTYNEDGYPLTKNEKGYSSETDYTFTYDCK